MLQSSRLSNRFKKKQEQKVIVPETPVQINENIQVPKENVELALVSASDLEETYKNQLIKKIESIPVWNDYSLEKQKELITTFVTSKLNSDEQNISEQEKSILIDKLCNFVTGFGPLNYLIKQDNVDVVYVNGLNAVHIEISSKILNTEIKLTQNQLDLILKNIFSFSDKSFASNEYVRNIKYENFIISVILPPISQSGVNIVIRKLRPELLELNTFINSGFVTEDLFEFLVSVVNSGKNVIVSGDSGSGKTLFIDALAKLALSNKRGVILEEFPQIQADSDTLMKFDFSSIKSDYEFRQLFSNLTKISPDFMVVDSNNPFYFNPSVAAIEHNFCNILSLRAGNVENVISKIAGAYMAEEKCTEKYAKFKFLSTFDYIVQINKCSDGIRRITSITELSPARTMALSMKNIAKWENNSYIIDIPQPYTSIKAHSLLPENAAVKKSRFYRESN